MRSAARGNGPARRLRDAGHRVVVGGLGVERQESRSVVIRVQYPQNGPPSKLNDLPKKKILGHEVRPHAEGSKLTRV